MRFHLDEHVASAVAEGLRRRGVDVSTTAEVGLLHAADKQHVAHALEEDRVIFTQDVDFLRIAATGQPHAGIVYCPQEKRSIGEIIRFLTLMHECFGGARDARAGSIPVNKRRYVDPDQECHQLALSAAKKGLISSSESIFLGAPISSV